MTMTSWRHAVALAAFGLLVRIWLIHSYPAIYGGDAVGRLANQHRVLLAHQLPLFQAGIHYLSGISENPLLARYYTAVIGAAAGAGFYYLAAGLLGARGALLCALLFVANPFVLAWSVVPYQEILMLAGLCFGFHFFFERRWAASALSLGAACFTRYEAWAACPVLIAAFALERGGRLQEWIRGLLLFAWAPLAWVAYNRGLGPEGTFVLEAPLSAWRLARYAYVGWITVKNTPAPVVLLAGAGAWVVWRQSLLRSPRWRMLAAFGGLFLAAILFSAHGVTDRPEIYIPARAAHLPIAGVILLAGLGLNRWPRWQTPLAALGVLLGLYQADGYVRRETSDPHIALSYQLAQYLDHAVGDGARVLVLPRPIPPHQIPDLLDRSFRAGGERKRQKMLEILQGLDISPPDYQRTLVHARLVRTHAWSLTGEIPSDEAQPEWIAVWSDFTPADAMAGRTATQVLRSGPVSVAVYRNDLP